MIVRDYYADKVILITGCTGFLGITPFLLTMFRQGRTWKDPKITTKR